MATAASLSDSESGLECPVCHDDYKDPKLLPCAHLVCRHCIVTWLSKAGARVGCPLCREPILPAGQDTSDYEALVDSLPTDLASAAAVESHKTLSGRDVCTVCEGDVAASSFCLQCDCKLCQTCAKSHSRIPALKNHVVEDLNNLTPRRLAETCRTTCRAHRDRPVELYCAYHKQLICTLCFPVSHRACYDVKPLAEAAQEKRAELREEAKELREMEATMMAQIQSVKSEFKTARTHLQTTFDELHQALRRRQQELSDVIRTDEESCMTSLTDVERDRGAVTSHARTVEHLVETAPDDALLDMLDKLTSRLKEVKKQSEMRDDEVDVDIGVTIDAVIVEQLKSTIAQLGQGDRPIIPPLPRPPVAAAPYWMAPVPPQPQPPGKPTGAELARVLKVGDRVKRSNEDSGDHGVVTDVPATWISARVKVTRRRGVIQGLLVNVRWDRNGYTGCYRMGEDGLYELELE